MVGGLGGPGWHVLTNNCGLCGQLAVEGGIGGVRPVPAQAGHFKRINATPSDLPFMSSGFATNPVPPQFGQSFGLNLPPSVASIVRHPPGKFGKEYLPLRITNKNPRPAFRSR